MITVSESAASKIRHNLDRRGKGIGIRLGVKTTGCSGLTYVLEYVDTPTEGDDQFTQEGFSIVISKKDQPFLNGLMLDYLKKGLNEGFEFINPNEKDRCGCGESFRI